MTLPQQFKIVFSVCKIIMLKTPCIFLQDFEWWTFREIPHQLDSLCHLPQMENDGLILAVLLFYHILFEVNFSLQVDFNWSALYFPSKGCFVAPQASQKKIPHISPILTHLPSSHISVHHCLYHVHVPMLFYLALNEWNNTDSFLLL